MSTLPSTPPTINPVEVAMGRTIRIQDFQNDPGAFATYYFGHEDTPVYREWDQMYLKEKRYFVECPLGHGKSWRITFVHPIHRLCYNRNVRMLIASKKMERAQEFVERIANELKTNQKLIDDFGDWAFVKQALGKPLLPIDTAMQKGFYDKNNWSKAKFTVQRPNNFRESTITASGVGGQIEGLRLDHIFLDDILDIEDRTSEIERNNHKEWIKSTVFGRIEPQGIIGGVGTPWAPDDVYAYFEELSKKEGAEWRFKRYQALPGWDGDPTHPVTPLLPYRYTFETLMGKWAEMGAVEFQAKLMCDPKASQDKWFKESWLRFVDRKDVPKLYDVVMGCDFNMSEKASADYTALVVLGRDEKGNFYILDIFREHLTDGHPQHIIDMWLRWKPWRIGVEANLFQKTIYNGVNALRPDCPVMPIHSATDKGQRILKMQPYFQTSRVFLVNDMVNRDFFVNEYSAFNPDGSHKNDDQLDALAMAFELTGYWSNEFNSQNDIQIVGGLNNIFQGYA